MNSDTPAGNRAWSERLRLPFPLLSDPDRAAASALDAVRRLGIGGWTIDLTKRRSVLAGRDGIIEAVWDKVKIRGHAAEALRAARAIDATRGSS